MKFRPHRGALDDAMREQFEFSSSDELLAHIQNLYEDVIPLENIKAKFYGYDERIKWDTWIITCDKGVLGFCDGDPFKTDIVA